MVQYYKIAGLNVEMDSYGRTVEQAKPYQIEKPDKVDLTITSYRVHMKERQPSLSDDDAEYMGTGASFHKQLLNFDGFRLHSSAVVVDGEAYLFSAPSGTGKSTHTSLWMKLFKAKAYILNDDKPSVRRIDGKWYAFGSPWSGKNDMSVNACVPLAGICMIERGAKNEISPCDAREAVHKLIAQLNRPKSAEYRIKLLELLDGLIQDVPIWNLKCNMDIEAAIVSYEAMSGNKWRDVL